MSSNAVAGCDRIFTSIAKMYGIVITRNTNQFRKIKSVHRIILHFVIGFLSSQLQQRILINFDLNAVACAYDMFENKLILS
jgi:uncharacterized membrane protein